ncbi:hypothetical protein HK104_003224 [Borealophlyctis nickersoniae]|nr:hypothetical protein HK104_003224 [Borealophlyctis nickersoniae]
MHYGFYVKPKEMGTSPFNILRKEQCRSLPLDTLYKRIESLDREEDRTLEEIKQRYMDQRRIILERMATF